MPIAATAEGWFGSDAEPEEPEGTDTVTPGGALAGLLDLLVQQPESEPLREAVQAQVRFLDARQEFHRAFAASSDERDALESGLLARFSATEICEAARTEFREKGNQDRMLLLARLLSQCGGDAVGALEPVVREFGGDIEYFVEVLAGVAGKDAEAASMLSRMLEHPAPDVRYRIASTVPDLPEAIGAPLLRALLEDPEDWIAEEAAEIRRLLNSRA